jgi:hypothetical protein
MEVEVFYDLLQNLRQELGFSNLTSHSQQLLMLDHSKWRGFIDQYKDTPLKRQVRLVHVVYLYGISMYVQELCNIMTRWIHRKITQ